MNTSESASEKKGNMLYGSASQHSLVTLKKSPVSHYEPIQVLPAMKNTAEIINKRIQLSE